MPNNGKLVLIIEDDDDIRELLRQLLEGENYAVKLATNGKEGLEALKLATPTLILLDLMMPVMNGYEFLESLRRLEPPLNGIPVILLTAAGEGATQAVSANEIIRKPSDLARLFQVLSRY